MSSQHSKGRNFLSFDARSVALQASVDMQLSITISMCYKNCIDENGISGTAGHHLATAANNPTLLSISPVSQPSAVGILHLAACGRTQVYNFPAAVLLRAGIEGRG